jgi:pSer/pThr/pTyr-binding forkhead associated (FHA) protein
VILRLALAAGAGPPRHVPLEGEVVVGRAPGCRVHVAARDVSRRHARFFEEGGALWVEDLGSRNGTFLNGARLSARARVGAGDEVALASEVVRVEPPGHGEDTLDAYPIPTPPPLPGRVPPPFPRAERPDPTRTVALPVREAPPDPEAKGWRGAVAAALKVLGKRGA